MYFHLAAFHLHFSLLIPRQQPSRSRMLLKIPSSVRQPPPMAKRHRHCVVKIMEKKIEHKIVFQQLFECILIDNDEALAVC